MDMGKGSDIEFDCKKPCEMNCKIFQGDYYRLGHGSDQHIRKPTPIQGLRGKKVVHVAVGALHCLAVTDTGEVYSWGNIIIIVVICYYLLFIIIIILILTI